jgi:hypothetical protein
MPASWSSLPAVSSWGEEYLEEGGFGRVESVNYFEAVGVGRVELQLAEFVGE